MCWMLFAGNCIQNFFKSDKTYPEIGFKIAFSIALKRVKIIYDKSSRNAFWLDLIYVALV